MISIDRTSSQPIHDQLREQLRFQIASGHYKIESALPSTRKLADQLDISFHTVRKVYQDLEREGLLASRPGAGFIVMERVPLSKSERTERGAAVVRDALQRLIGLGISEPEIDYLFQEQLSLIEGSGSDHKLLAVFPYREMASLCAEQIEHTLQQPVQPATLADFGRHTDADFIFAPYAHLRQVMSTLPRADVIGIITYLRPEALEQIARLSENQTLGVISKYVDAIPPLTSEIRSSTAFSGQMIAASVDESTDHLKQIIGQTDLIVFTPDCRRRMLGIMKGSERHIAIAPVVSQASLAAIRLTVPV
ncbi:MAG: GntR family transcriptional regulator [Rhodothermales bacterium]